MECVCADEAVHRRRIEARARNIAGAPDTSWARVIERRAEYQPWTEARLVLDMSSDSPAQLLDKALSYPR